MANKLMIILHNSSQQRATLLIAPLFQAAVAAALHYEVEIILSGANYELALEGVAKRIYAPDTSKSVYDWLKEAIEAGAVLKVFSPPAGLRKTDMIAEVQEVVGGAYLICETMDIDTVTLTY